MSAAARPLIPASAPFGPDEIHALNQVIGGASAEQRQWLSGFLAGLAAANAPSLPVPAAPPRAKLRLTILYATQSGNAEAIAYDLRKAATRRGFEVKVVDAADTSPAALAEAGNLLVIASTWGEGEPPERAIGFMAALHADGAPRLDGLRYAVLALGDSSYAQFCATGIAIDRRLEELGAVRLGPRIDSDLDTSGPVQRFTEQALTALQPEGEPAAGAVIQVDFGRAAPIVSREHPFAAAITERINLASSRSTKETWHLALALDGSGLAYEPGDALGILPENDPAVVEAVMTAAGLAGDPALETRLARELEITTLTRPVLQAYAALAHSAELDAILGGDVQPFLAGHQLVDLLRRFPARLDAAALTGLLRKLPPRLYSIASSPRAHQGEAHLLVGLVRWRRAGEERLGVTSGQLARRVASGDRLPVYLQPNRHFRLPADPATPIVMVGAGTGIAPFRGFTADRRATGATGRSWLVLGERSFTHDFLYQLEWQEALEDGSLTRLDLAFSRDQPAKRYVQRALKDAGRELFAWLEEGAHLYVCGAIAMGRDVEAALLDIAATQGRDPAAWLDGLRATGRYHRDVY
jgi:sulfite reductase (NADPH) flavoprotein alpha-component